MDAPITIGDECPSRRIPIRTVTVIELDETAHREGDKISNLDHRVCARVQRVTELDDPLDAMYSCHLVPAGSHQIPDIGVVVFLLIEEHHPAR